jgi:chemotaxis protein methyltransferase CheR
MERMPLDSCSPLEKLEISLLLEGICRHYGYDFRGYAFSSIRRRVWHRIKAERLHTVTALTDKVLHSPAAMEHLFQDFSIHVTEMFRDPSFFLAFRNGIIPQLRNKPMIRIWHAGCSTGEEVYSMAILLSEEGLLHKARIYATDFNQKHLEKAGKGIFPLHKMQLYTKNYLLSGGKKAFSEYYSVKNMDVVFHPGLADNLFFSQHNLATDHSFNEFHIIICRNVLIYFNEALQQRVLELFDSSLIPSGILGLGNKEGIRSRNLSGTFEAVDLKENIFRKTAWGKVPMKGI